MDYHSPPEKQRKKKDKAKEKKDRNGGFSSKHVRQVEANLEKHSDRKKASKRN